jgi:hypothetical protein
MLALESQTQEIMASLEQTEPVAILRDGVVTGYYVPVMPAHEDTQAILVAAQKMQEWLEARGISEDDLIADFDALRKSQRQKNV